MISEVKKQQQQKNCRVKTKSLESPYTDSWQDTPEEDTALLNLTVLLMFATPTLHNITGEKFFGLIR